MSAKKPPPRPPLPRPSTAKSGQPTGVAPVRSLKNAFASISIRYSSSNKESDSDEEISIVRKGDASVLGSNDGETKEGENCEEQHNKVTQDETDTHSSRPEDSNTEGVSNLKSKSPGPRLKLSNKSISNEELGKAFDRRSFPKQKTWPGYSRLQENTDPGIMKFLRGRDRDQGQETKGEVVKDDVLLLSEKEETDIVSLPSKVNVETSLDGKLKPTKDRSRSPSPFRRLNRQSKNSESAGEKSTNSSGISLSSLLASLGKEEVQVVNEDSASDFEDSSSDVDFTCISERPSSVDFSLEFEEARLKPQAHPDVDKTPQFASFCFFTLAVYLYLITWTPPFVSGLVTGMFFMYLFGCAFLWLFCPEDTLAERYERELMEYENRVARTPKPRYKSVDPRLLLRRGKLEGWMYKAYNYDPDKFDYSSETVPVFASLNGTNLTLSHPKTEGTGKKFDPRSVEERNDVLFARHEHYDLTGSNVSLLPQTMTMKRIWSRKFPICIELDKPTAVAENITYNGSIEEDDDVVIVHKIKQQDSLEEAGVLYLFPRIGREKEEWFYHLHELVPTDNCDESGSLKSSSSYPHYMAKLLPQPDMKLQAQQRQIAWVNVLFGRAFWDVWQDKYWTNKIKQRFENKLAKLKKPSFIRDITISDLDLGDSLPVINKASPPVLDKQGTWVDLEVTYNGGLIFTFEGHLNIEGYLAYFLNLGKNESELEMAELQRKYEMEEKESLIAEEQDDGSESESPPESDSDFESPESDVEEFSFKAIQGPLPLPSNKDQTEDGRQGETSNPITCSSFEGDDEMVGSNDLLATNPTSDPEVGDKNSSKFRKQVYSQKQSSSEETPTTSKATSESPPSSPVKSQLDLSAQHGTKRKIFSVIERLAKSKWVKKAAETGIVKRAAERFSNLPIILTVEVQTVKGTLALNIPPPPTNRLWYGFRGTPMLFVSARPKLGDRQVKLTHVTDWIEKKLKQEFRNMFVLPNMEDLPIRLMNSGLEEKFPEW